ncbi:MAG: phage holin family protein [Candidatus Bathyarchaeia archaeon]
MRQSISKIVLRIVVLWIIEVVGIMVMSRVVPGLVVENWRAAFVLMAAIGLLNALLWPVLSKAALPFIVFTLGIGALVLNGVIIWLTSVFVSGVSIEGWALILTPIGIAGINTLTSGMLAIDDDATFYRAVLTRHLRRGKHSPATKTPGTVFLEIDGLCEPILRQALKRGCMPTLSTWLEKGNHKLVQWETDLSSQTGASQAGILHGNNSNIPAYRWVEKENNNKMMVSSGLLDAPIVEKRISNGGGLLSKIGASRSNLFSGDAEEAIFTYSRLSNMKKFYTSTWYFFYSNPYNFPRTLALYCWDIILEFHSRLRQWALHISPRLKLGIVYYFVRATANVFLREVTTYTIVGDIMEGKVNSIYATYMGYDEIAHHTGVADEEAFRILKQLDRQFARLESATQIAARHYDLVILSDHGQSPGATFKQRYGITLEDLVRKFIPANLTLHSELDTNLDHFGEATTYPIQQGIERSKQVLTRKKPKESKAEAQVIVLASGNLGLIYFTQWKERLSYEKIEKTFPGLISNLTNHPGIGFVMVNSEQDGALAIGCKGSYHLKSDKTERENPLSSFGPNVAAHLRRYNEFSNAPDILVNSFYDSENGEVAAFEEKIGSHGGIGGTQSKPFLLYPSRWALGEEQIVGAETLHHVLKRQLGQVENSVPK